MSNTSQSLTIEQLDKIFSNSLRIDILVQLLAHRQLRLSEITELVQRSKSATSRQMKQLVEYDMIEEFEQDLNNPGSPHKAYRISQNFVKTFMAIQNGTISDKSTYVSYMMGMLALSRRLNELTYERLQALSEGKSQDDLSEIEMGVMFVPSAKMDEIRDLINNFVSDMVQLVDKSDDKDAIISLGFHPILKMIGE